MQYFGGRMCLLQYWVSFNYCQKGGSGPGVYVGVRTCLQLYNLHRVLIDFTCL